MGYKSFRPTSNINAVLAVAEVLWGVWPLRVTYQRVPCLKVDHVLSMVGWALNTRDVRMRVLISLCQCKGVIRTQCRRRLLVLTQHTRSKRARILNTHRAAEIWTIWAWVNSCVGMRRKRLRMNRVLANPQLMRWRIATPRRSKQGAFRLSCLILFSDASVIRILVSF